MQDLVSATLGISFLGPQSTSLSAVLPETSATAPTILLVSPGTDPMSEIQQLAKQRSPCTSVDATASHPPNAITHSSSATDTTRHSTAGLGVKLLTVSLGRNQWRAAEAAVEQAATNGCWV